jgi:thioredoxin
MKKIIFCMVALLVLAACTKKADNQENSNTVNPSAQDEMTTNNQSEEGHDGWMKQSTLLSSKPMVVDFYATWCGPCKQLVPILDKIEQNHKGEVIFKRIDVDQEPELAMEFHIDAIPLLMFITPTGDYQTLTGLQEASVIEGKIAELLAHSTK